MRRRPTRGARGTSEPVVSELTGSGPPLILLHGLAGSARWWRHNVPVLSRSFRVAAIDLPGFGASHRDARLVLDKAAGQLVATMDRLGFERAHVVGHSMGGLVAGGLAADYPERVDRLVLVDAGFLSLDPSIIRRVTGPIAALRWTAPSLLPVVLGDTLRSGPIRMAGATYQILQADWQTKLPLISAPTLVIWASTTPSARRRSAVRSPRACRGHGWSSSRARPIARCGSGPRSSTARCWPFWARTHHAMRVRACLSARSSRNPEGAIPRGSRSGPLRQFPGTSAASRLRPDLEASWSALHQPA